MGETKFSWVLSFQKAAINAVKQGLLILLSLVIANPELILKLLGSWKDMTVGAVILYLGNVFYNWLKNKNLG